MSGFGVMMSRTGVWSSRICRSSALRVSACTLIKSVLETTPITRFRASTTGSPVTCASARDTRTSDTGVSLLTVRTSDCMMSATFMVSPKLKKTLERRTTTDPRPTMRSTWAALLPFGVEYHPVPDGAISCGLRFCDCV